jgi:phosphonate transport system substrate-binding protein
MHKIVWIHKFALTLTICALLLTGCGGRATPAPTVAPTLAVESTPMPVPTETPEDSLPTLEGGLLPTEEGNFAPTQEGEVLFPPEENGDLLPTGEDSELFPVDETEDPFSSGDDGLNAEDFSETPEGMGFQPTPADIPLGQPGNPLVLGVVTNSEENLELLDASQQFVEQLSALTGYSMQAISVNTTTELLNGMQVGAIHMAWMQPFTYILASRRGYAKVTLVTKHFGVYAYGTQFLANSNSDITSYFDTTTNTNTADAFEALSQLADKRPCWVDPLSASGYVVPSGSLAAQEVTTGSALFMQSHTAVVRALYVMGICDFGATYAIYGDPRTASVLQEDLPDVMQKVVVIWQTGEIIPNLAFTFQGELPEEITEKVTETLMDYVLGPDGLEMVNAATGYEITDLKQIDDTFYDPLRNLLQFSRVNLRTLVGK